MKELSNMKMKFGIYRGTPVKYVPDSYLEFLLRAEIAKGKLLLYIKRKLNIPKDKYEVQVKDSLNADGLYQIYAHSSKEARDLISKRVQGTQSYCGTIISSRRIL